CSRAGLSAKIKAIFSKDWYLDCALMLPIGNICDYSPDRRELLLLAQNISREVSACVFRCGPLLSAGTASASSRNPLCGVFRHVLFPQESTVLRSKQPS